MLVKVNVVIEGPCLQASPHLFVSDVPGIGVTVEKIGRERGTVKC